VALYIPSRKPQTVPENRPMIEPAVVPPGE
jgi:hypothetical protein